MSLSGTYDNSSGVLKIQKYKDNIMSDITTAKATRNPTVPAVIIILILTLGTCVRVTVITPCVLVLLFEADPDGGGDDHMSVMVETA